MNNDSEGYRSLQEKLAAFYKQWDGMSAQDKHQMLEAIKKQLDFATELLNYTVPYSFNEADRREIDARAREVRTRLKDLNSALSSRRHSFLCNAPRSSYN